MSSAAAAAASATAASPDSSDGSGGDIDGRLAQLQSALGQLVSGVAGPKRRGLEMEIESAIHELTAELKGEAPMPVGYCGSCYGAATDKCCNTCDEVWTTIQSTLSRSRYDTPATLHQAQTLNQAHTLMRGRAHASWPL